MDRRIPLVVENLSVYYNGKIVLKDIDYEAPLGRCIALIGPNGAGKTTFLRAVLGLLPQVKGGIFLFGDTVDKQRRRVAYVPQRESVDWTFPVSALDVVLMGLYGRKGWFGCIGGEDREKAYQVLERLQMQDFAHVQIGQLSGGQQQRIFLARALIQEAELYLMDEPFAGIDVVTEQKLVEIFRELQREGKTLLCVHHDLQTLSDYFEYILVLNRYKIAEGDIKQVFCEEVIHKAYTQPLVV